MSSYTSVSLGVGVTAGCGQFCRVQIYTKLTYNYLHSLESKTLNFVSILFIVIHN